MQTLILIFRSLTLFKVDACNIGANEAVYIAISVMINTLSLTHTFHRILSENCLILPTPFEDYRSFTFLFSVHLMLKSFSIYYGSILSKFHSI